MQPDAKTITYRDYKKFNEEDFRSDLEKQLSQINLLNCLNFENTYLSVLNKHAPCKQKLIRANESPFMNKHLKKSIMSRSRLRNKFLKEKTEENRKNYKKMRNYCVRLVKKTKKEFYSSLDPKVITDNKKVWKIVKPMFTDKVQQTQNIILIENKRILSNSNIIAEKLNNFFINTVPNLKIKLPSEIMSGTEDIHDPVLIAIKKFENHPSISKIKPNMNTKFKLEFSNITSDVMMGVVKNLDSSKATTYKNIPIKTFKQHIDIYIDKVTDIYNSMINSSVFPDNLKLADITPVHKKKTSKCNYLPVSVLTYF